MKYKNPNIESSYRQYDLGKTLYNLVLKLKPKVIIEFGTLNGYSAIAMGMALHELGEGRLISYDLWDGYRFRKGIKSLVNETVENYGLFDFVKIEKGDFNTWIPEHFDLLHIDMSNDGKIINDVAKKVKNFSGEVIFEGGCKERDQVQWMTRYNKQPIQSCGVKYEVIEDRFPSISRLIK